MSIRDVLTDIDALVVDPQPQADSNQEPEKAQVHGSTTHVGLNCTSCLNINNVLNLVKKLQSPSKVVLEKENIDPERAVVVDGKC